MTAALIPTPVMQFLDADGNPLVGGKVYTYAAGTSTPLATFTDYGGATPNANPVILNSRGEASIWFGTAAYKLELYTAATVLIWTADNVSASTPVVYGTGVAAALAINVGTAGSILVNGGALVGTTLNASGLVAMAAAATVGTTLAVSGTATMAAINASGTVAMAGAATVGTTLGVTGTSTMAAINASGVLTASNTTDASSATTGGTIISGGLGVAKKLYVGSKFTITTSGVANDFVTMVNTAGTAKTWLMGPGTPADGFFGLYNSTNGVTAWTVSDAGAVTIPGTLGVTGAVGIGATPLITDGKLLVAAAGNVGLTLRQNTTANRFQLFVGDGTAGTAADDNYIRNLSTTLHIQAGAAGTTEVLTISSAGIHTMPAYGAGAATFSAAGVISSVSDERLKIKDGTIADPIPMMMALEPGYYFGKPEANMGDGRQLGFYAQNVRSAIGPEAAPDPEDQVSLDADGNEVSRTTRPWGYYDRSVLAVAIEALKVHEGRLAALQADFEAYKNSHP